MSYSGVELRKLPPSFRIKMGQLLDFNDSWKKLMAQIPSEGDPSKPKYTAEHVSLIERHGRTSGVPPGEILLDEWSTSGRKRPTTEVLLDLLIKCEMFRAADYVASELLGQDAPARPESGPAAKIAEITGKVEERFSVEGLKDALERLDNHDHSQGNLVPFHVQVIRKGTRDFAEEECIGKGAFGSVFRLDLKEFGGPVLAVKLLNPANSVMESQFLTELRVLSEFRHGNLVPLVGYCTNGPQYCLVYEFMERGSLLGALDCEANGSKPLNWVTRASILHGVGKGLHYLHTAKEQPLIHRDIKSANILLDEALRPKIGDFGLAKSLTGSNQTSALTSTIFGTSAYMAPEAFRGDISPKMDIFSFGVVMLEVLTGLAPYDEEREGNDIVTFLDETVEDDDITPFLDSKAGTVDVEEATAIYHLARKCLDKKQKRPLSSQVVQELQSLSSLKRLK